MKQKTKKTLEKFANRIVWLLAISAIAVLIYGIAISL